MIFKNILITLMKYINPKHGKDCYSVAKTVAEHFYTLCSGNNYKRKIILKITKMLTFSTGLHMTANSLFDESPLFLHRAL